MTDERREWQRVGVAIQERMKEMAMSQAELVTLSGVSSFTVRKLMGGEPGNYRADRLGKVARALGWMPLAIESIKRGGRPIEIYEGELSEEAKAASDLDRQIEHLSMVVDVLQREMRAYEGRLARLERSEPNYLDLDKAADDLRDLDRHRREARDELDSDQAAADVESVGTEDPQVADEEAAELLHEQVLKDIGQLKAEGVEAPPKRRRRSAT